MNGTFDVIFSLAITQFYLCRDLLLSLTAGYNNIDTEPNYYSVSSSDSLANLSCQSSYKSAKFRPSYVQCPVG